MNKIILNTGTFLGGYFVNNPTASQLAYENDGNGFHVTCKHKKGLLSSILKSIAVAEYYIKICSFIVDNKQIVDALRDKLKEGEVSIFILTAVDDKSIKSDMLGEDENEVLSKSRHFEFIDELVEFGAHVRASSNAHAKFVIIDGNVALLTSANLTEPSLNSNDKGKAPNDESGIEITEMCEVKTLERLFDTVFLYGTEFRKFLNFHDQTQLISKNENEVRPQDFPNTNSNIIWTYENHYQLIYNKLIAAVSTCQKSIKLSTYSIVELQNLKDFVNELRHFIDSKRGSIIIFCRAMNHREDHLIACKELAEMGVRIVGDMFNHSKGISVDDSLGIIFTANIDGRYGLKSGFEVGYVIAKSNRSFLGFTSFLDYQIGSAPFVFKLSPTKVELFDFYRYWYKTKETKINTTLSDKVEIKLRLNSQFSGEFQYAISNYPIFYTAINQNDKKYLQFKINGKAYLLDVLNETTFAVKKQLERYEVVRAEEYIFFYDKINLVGYES